MSVVNEYAATNVKFSTAESCVFLTGEQNDRHTFNFTLYCRRRDDVGKPMYFFFNLNDHKCLIVNPLIGHFGQTVYDCKLLRFWLENDVPVLSARLYEKQAQIMSEIESEFQLKYAALILDGIINQD